MEVEHAFPVAERSNVFHLLSFLYNGWEIYSERCYELLLCSSKTGETGQWAQPNWPSPL